MRSLHLTILIFCQILLASFILYSTVTSASPVEQVKHIEAVKVSQVDGVVESKQPLKSQELFKPIVEPQAPVVKSEKNADLKPIESNEKAPVVSRAVPQAVQKEVPESKRVQVVAASIIPPVESAPVKAAEDARVVPVVASISKVVESPNVRSVPAPEAVKIVAVVPKEEPIKHQERVASPVEVSKVEEQQKKVLSGAPVSAAIVSEPQKVVQSKEAVKEIEKKSAAVEQYQPVPVVSEKQQVVEKSMVKPVVEEKIVGMVPKAPVVVQSAPVAAKEQVPVSAVNRVEQMQPVEPVASVKEPKREVYISKSVLQAPVKGGQGPLHLLASSLCSYQPERLVADENLNLLYKERASVRKSLFDFMSLKFTNLEKLSSRLNPGYASLEVVPPKKVDQANPGVVPSHGWPVVGVCTAHDLKLMAEAAWCDSQPQPIQSVQPVPPSEHQYSDKQATVVVSGGQNRAQSARSIQASEQQQQVAAPASNDQHSAVISKLLHVNDVKDAPVIENSLASLNLTQQQLVSIQAQATSTRECRRNALRLTKALFNHLAEDQKNESNSWPKLYSHLSDDDCARKRMIDVLTALAGFRGESTSIRRDNVEYAFAMDDLRTKVLESEVNVPLTFDKQFIEVEQFLQQSVKLMLANIDPGRARLTSMRYRSLMPGPVSADDQCIELHQRLLAKNYPTDCNPTQFGQLPDVLRMAASSLALWSIEVELNKYSSRVQDYASASSVVQPPVKQDVNECIANLVSA